MELAKPQNVDEMVQCVLDNKATEIRWYGSAKLKNAEMKNVAKAFQSNSILQKLKLYSVSFDDDGCAALLRNLPASVQVLTFSNKYITNNGYCRIEEFLTMTKSLLQLRIEGKKISEYGKKRIIAGIRKNNSLQVFECENPADKIEVQALIDSLPRTMSPLPTASTSTGVGNQAFQLPLKHEDQVHRCENWREQLKNALDGLANLCKRLQDGNNVASNFVGNGEQFAEVVSKVLRRPPQPTEALEKKVMIKESSLMCSVFGFIATQLNVEMIKVLSAGNFGLEHRAVVLSDSVLSPLGVAIHAGKVELVRYLLLRGADASATIHHGDERMTLADFASFLGHKTMEKMLKVDVRSTISSLHRYVTRGKVDEAKDCLSKLAPLQLNLEEIESWLQEFDPVEMSLLHHAVYQGSKALVEMLISECSDKTNLLGGRNNHGRTALHLAAIRGRVDVVTLLLDEGANIDELVHDSYLQTPAILACEYGKYNAAKLLAKRGANFLVSDKAQLTAIDVLFRQRKEDVAAEIMSIVGKVDPSKVADMLWTQWKAQHPREIRATIAELNAPLNVQRIFEHVKLTGKDSNQGFSLLESTFLLSEDGSNFPDELVLRALAFLCVPSIATENDVAATLNQYDKLSGPMSPLVLLAHARFFERMKDKDSRAVLLRKFVHHVASKEEAYSWLSESEKQISSSTSQSNSFTNSVRSVLEKAGGLSKVEKELDVLKSRLTNSQQEPLDELMRMVGLKEVKELAMRLYTDNLADQHLRDKGYAEAVAPRVLNFLFLGNPGTGKTVTAELFSKLLEESGARAGHKFLKMTAAEVLRKGSKQFAAELASLTGGRPGVGPPPSAILRKGMSVEVKDAQSKEFPGKISFVDYDKNLYHVDYADGTVEEKIPRGRITATAEKRNVGGVLFLDEAYDLDPANNSEGRAVMNEIMSVAEEFRDIVTIILAGYKDEIESKLVRFNPGIASRFQSVHFSDFNETQLAEIWRKHCSEKRYECDEFVVKVASRRLARRLGQKGFGNAREARKLFESSISFAKKRFFDETDKVPTIRVEDVIGRKPSREENEELDTALKDLDKLTGLGSVKESVKQLLITAEANYEKELRGEPIDLIKLNYLFLGNPGTGKTSIASIFGKILKSLRYLSDGDLLLKVASDFIGDKVGESQSKTRAILDSAEGKVLFIDEAYVLDDQMYGKQVLDTLVEKVQGTAGADLAVVMAGYKQPMMKMLRDQNPGLSSRFDPKFAIEFDDYTDTELLKILSLVVSEGSIQMPIMVKLHAVQELAKRRSLPNFGNARAVQTLVTKARPRREKRLREDPRGVLDFTVTDIDPDLEDQDPQKALADLQKFGNVGMELSDLGVIVQQVKKEGGSLEGLVNHYIFTGPPGTGKTSVARLLARVLFAYGILATKNVVETSGMNLVAGYIGQSSEKVQKVMEEARGGVLFIDEAYYMTQSGYKSEVIGTLLNNLTLPEYMDGKTVVVLAGYKDDMHSMLSENPGLKSRFTSYVNFESMSPAKCFEVVLHTLESSQPVGFSLKNTAASRAELEGAFEELQRRPGWANGRDAVEMAKKIVRQRALRIGKGQVNEPPEVVTDSDVQIAVKEFIASRPNPSNTLSQSDHACFQQLHTMAQGTMNQPIVTRQTQEKSAHNYVPTAVVGNETPEDDMEKGELEDRDVQIQQESLLQEFKSELEEKLKEDLETKYREALEAELRRIKKLEEAARRAKEEERHRLLEMETKRRAIIRKLAQIGRCPAGFAWRREGGGFRCAGGSHYASVDQLGIDRTELDKLFPER